MEAICEIYETNEIYELFNDPIPEHQSINSIDSRIYRASIKYRRYIDSPQATFFPPPLTFYAHELLSTANHLTGAC